MGYFAFLVGKIYNLHPVLFHHALLKCRLNYYRLYGYYLIDDFYFVVSTIQNTDNMITFIHVCKYKMFACLLAYISDRLYQDFNHKRMG